MSKNSLKSSSVSLKHIAGTVAFVLVLIAALPMSRNSSSLHARIRKVHAAEVLLRPAALLVPHRSDFWHTEGNRILDTHNRPVRISGVNWSGFETKEAVPGGLEAQDYRAILKGIKQNGFNTVRLPFSNEMIETPAVPEHVGFESSAGDINTDLRDLNSLEIMDKIIAYSAKIGLKVILDNHRSEAGSSAEESGLWYTDRFPESAWVKDWTMLANRYKGNSAVIGVDLRNEPHNADKGGSCWDCGGANDWHRAATRAGDAVLAVNPHLLVFVEGVDSYAGDSYWWGGNLEGVRRSPVHLSIPNRLVYSAHEYGPTEYAQSWFNASTTPASLASVWRRHWAYISEAGIAPVWIGEFGTSNDDSDVQSLTAGSEGQWFNSLVQFLAAHPALNWTYWGINGEDRYGLLDASYAQAANNLKAEALATIRSQVPDAIKPSDPVNVETYASVPTTFTQPAFVSSTPKQQGETQPIFIPVPHLAKEDRIVALNTGDGTTALRGRSARPSSHDTVDQAIADNIRSAVSKASQNMEENSTEVSQ